MASKWKACTRRPLSEKQLQELSVQILELCVCDDEDSDYEPENDESTLVGASEIQDRNILEDLANCGIDSIEIVNEEEVREDVDAVQTDECIHRKWRKIDVEVVENYNIKEGAVNEQFSGCETPADVFVRLLGDNIENITYQSNLYAVQNNKILNMKEGELLAFFGLNFFMGYH
ncbi:hypothetical protein ILUMI_03631 [Ignelater luminosus]|uniref:PiggyBac transposable element-derived protein domain-containing protein n=1 Tax=Ignelater luminosus TaxID=2038154 RepID=A0A8K0DFW7_IGNLU|nr:hypothetical protein ILUMI_03631 [Ignelater luminosus]